MKKISGEIPPSNRYGEDLEALFLASADPDKYNYVTSFLSKCAL
jgi:hypothetical protein